MTLSQELADAYLQLENSIQNLISVHRASSHQEDNTILSGWIVVTSSINILDSHEMCDDCDELDLKTCVHSFSKRGQNPLMGLGLAHEFIRHYELENNE